MKNNLADVLSVKPFLFLFLAQIFSQIATNMMNFVLIFVAFELTHSNTAVSGIVLAFTIPAILLGIPAGVYVDKWNKKRVLLITNILRSFLLLFLAFWYSNLFIVYLVTFAISFITQFFIPAETPMIPTIVKKNQLMSANALFGMGMYGSILIAYALSGPLLLLYGKTIIFLFLSVCFLIATIFTTFIQVKREDELDKEKDVSIDLVPELGHALKLIMKTKAIYHSLVLLTLSQILVLILAVLGPGYATQVLSISPEQFPLLFVTPAAIGMVLCAVIITHFSSMFSKKSLATAGVFLSGVVMLLLPYGGYVASILGEQTVLVLIFLALLLGISNALIFVPSTTILQEETTEGARGKVYGALNALIGVFSLIPVIATGSLSDVFGVGNVLTVIGVILIIVGIFRRYHS